MRVAISGCAASKSPSPVIRKSARLASEAAKNGDFGITGVVGSDRRIADIYSSQGKQLRPSGQYCLVQAEFRPAQDAFIFVQNFRRHEPPDIIAPGNVEDDLFGQSIAECRREQNVGVDDDCH